jgi:hypothetical protein
MYKTGFASPDQVKRLSSLAKFKTLPDGVTCARPKRGGRCTGEESIEDGDARQGDSDSCHMGSCRMGRFGVAMGQIELVRQPKYLITSSTSRFQSALLGYPTD